MTCVSKDMVKQYKKIFSYSKYTHAYNIVLTPESYFKMYEKIKHKWFLNKKIIKLLLLLALWQNGNVLMILLMQLII